MLLCREIETIISNTILQNRTYHKSFEEIITGLENKFLNFNPIQNSFSLDKYFSSGKGEATVKKMLIEDERIEREWLKPYTTKYKNVKNDFRGLYIFIHDSSPFYVGISKRVICRLIQHLKGKSHYTSTLAYKIGLIIYENLNGTPYTGDRNSFEYHKYVEPAKQFLIKQKVAIIPISNIEELAMFEIYCSMRLRTWLNDFETH